ncbi:MAG: pilus assembly protein [Chloroflexi bacterium]|nr:pilus assembly protein [Chloroflexota bacterium]
MKRATRESGQATLEYGLAAVVFFTMLLFVFEGGRVLYSYVTVSQAAQAGARYGVTHGANSSAPVSAGDYAALQTAAQGWATGLDPADLTITATWNPDNQPGSTVTVNVAYVTGSLTGLFWSGQTLTLRGQSTMVIQN